MRNFQSTETTRREKYAENYMKILGCGNVEYSNVFVVFLVKMVLNSHFTRPEMSFEQIFN